MRWLATLLAGPTLWATLFAATYALHGIGCAQGWVSVDTPFGNLHRTALAALWLTGIALHIGIVGVAPKGNTLEDRLPRLGAWIGLIATVATLLPILLVSSCR